MSTHTLRPSPPTYAPPSHGHGPRSESRAHTPVWSGARRVAFRFAFVYFALYIPSFPLAWFPRPFGAPLLSRLASPVAPNAVQRWVLAHILHVSPPWTSGFAGAGDNPVGWANLVCFLALAAVGAALWTLADRRRTDYTALHQILRAAVRLTLGVVMLWYGITKLGGLQFPAPRLGRLAQPVGELTPMALLWTVMGYSPAYARFAGGVETVGALLLLHRRTTTLGALILFGTTANLLALNLGYDVGQKLFSAHLLVMAGLLVAPDARRLADVLVFARSPAPYDERPPLRTRRRTALARGAWATYFAFVVVDFARFVLAQPPQPPRPSVADGGDGGDGVLVGLYDVVSIATPTRAPAAPAAPAAPSDDWRRLVIERDGFATLTLAGGGVRRLHVSRDRAGRRLTVAWAPRDTLMPVTLTATAYTGASRFFDVSRARATDVLAIVPTGADRLWVAGRVGGDSIDVQFRRRAASSLPLVRWRPHAVWRDTFWSLL